MPADLVLERIGDDLIEFRVDSPSDARSFAQQLRNHEIGEDVVAGLARVTVRFHPRDAASITARIHDAVRTTKPEIQTFPVQHIDVHYGGDEGPDLRGICDTLGLSQQAFIDLHTSQTHTVEMMGFTPGFAYISGLPDGLGVPRLAEPRPRVPRGSVGISAAFTGLYALAGPGGWPLIGRTQASLFSPERTQPFLLSAGQRVKFRSV